MGSRFKMNVGILALVMTCSSGRALAQTTATVSYTQTPIQVEGDLSQFPSSSKIFDLTGLGGSDNTASYYALWDDQYLYFGVEVGDAALFCAALPADSTTAYAQDGVELNFDILKKKAVAPGDPDFRQWIIPICHSASNNVIYDAYGTGDGGDTSFNGSASANFKLNGTLNDDQADTGYSAIVRIPWSDLNITPANDMSFGFDGAVNDADSVSAGETTYLDWANIYPFAQPDKWGELSLTGKAAQTGSDATSPQSDGGFTFTDGANKTPTRTTGTSGCDCNVQSEDTQVGLGGIGLMIAMLVLAFRKRSA